MKRREKLLAYTMFALGGLFLVWPIIGSTAFAAGIVAVNAWINVAFWGEVI